MHFALAHRRVDDCCLVPHALAVPVQLNPRAHREEVLRARTGRLADCIGLERRHHLREAANQRDRDAHGELGSVDLARARAVLPVLVGAHDDRPLLTWSAHESANGAR